MNKKRRIVQRYARIIFLLKLAQKHEIKDFIENLNKSKMNISDWHRKQLQQEVRVNGNYKIIWNPLSGLFAMNPRGRHRDLAMRHGDLPGEDKGNPNNYFRAIFCSSKNIVYYHFYTPEFLSQKINPIITTLAEEAFNKHLKTCFNGRIKRYSHGEVDIANIT